MRDNWSMTYALSLTKDQWTDEISERFFNDIAREIASFPFREPARAIVDLLSLDTDGKRPFHSNWKIYSVSITADVARLFLTAIFWGSTKPFMQGRGIIIGVEPVLDGSQDGFDTFMIGAEAVLRINNSGEVSSDLLEAWTDPDNMPQDWSYDCDGCLFALVD
jgi:hypothetical protein